jgi:hypothetical protein
MTPILWQAPVARGGGAIAQARVSWIVPIRAEAEWDVEPARDWYEQRKNGLGGEFLDEFAAAMRALEHSPEREPLYYPTGAFPAISLQNILPDHRPTRCRLSRAPCEARS